jgi:hypothetical protein
MYCRACASTAGDCGPYGQVIEREDGGVRRGRGLLEAAVRHLEDGVEALDELAEARGVQLEDGPRAALDRVVGDGQRHLGGTAEVAVEGVFDAAAIGHDLDGRLTASATPEPLAVTVSSWWPGSEAEAVRQRL